LNRVRRKPKHLWIRHTMKCRRNRRKLSREKSPPSSVGRRGTEHAGKEKRNNLEL